MDQNQTAITAAFVMEGLHKDHGYYALLQAWDKGAIELVSAVMEYVPIIHRLRSVAEAVVGEYPGVFEYEVSAPFGHWLGDTIAEEGDMPEQGHAVAILTDLVESFFRRDADADLSRRLHQALYGGTEPTMPQTEE